MRHLFASGEYIHKKNIKRLEQGEFLAEYLEYDGIDKDTVYSAIGKIDGKDAVVKFKVNSDSYEEIKFKHSIRILMQSDIVISEWESYEVCFNA